MSLGRTSPDLPWKTRLFIATYCFGVDVCRRSNGTLNRGLMNMFDPKFPPSKTSSDHTIDPSRNLWFRLFLPSATISETAKLPLIVYFHGGGFAFSAANSKPYNDFCIRLADEIPAVVVSINYRLSPEHRFPTQYDDCFEALKFIDSDAVVLPPQADRSRCFLAGDSAGGNIAHHVMVRSADEVLEKMKLAGLIMIQPFFGGEERTESELRLTKMPLVNLERTDWMWKVFLPEGSDRDHEAANVFGGGSKSVDLSAMNFPATMVFVGGFDPLQDRQRMYYEGLKKSGKEVKLVEYPNAIHGFYALPELPDSALLIKEVRDFIQK
ncbi:probable carboxylesterase 18 [Cornus florida]|uniref:probable carboxylesterase 18 n=1 Tax=Cornus florida TaxID=4283 RepID=UPI00289C1842|nr:probable carboxylesterase 18 [Cornus florida]